jgi:hypothetical protein
MTLFLALIGLLWAAMVVLGLFALLSGATR